MPQSVLLVLQSFELRSQLRDWLRPAGYRVAEAEPEQAQTALESYGPDAVLVGSSVVSELSSSLAAKILVQEAEAPPLLPLTPWLQAGFCEVLCQPLEPQVVRTRLASALAQRHLAQVETETLQGLDLLLRGMRQGGLEAQHGESLRRRGGIWSELSQALGQLNPLQEIRRELRETPAPSGHGRILVVEDDPVSRRLLTLHLEHRGYEVSLAEDGVVALEILQNQVFDAILLDQMMPRLDGFGVLAQLKADPRWQDIPVIVISANEAAEDVIRLIEAGAQDHLVKPYNVRLLDARLRASLMAKRMRDQEMEYLRGVEVLTQAAAAVENEEFRPEVLGPLSLRQDAIGRLARVFQKMGQDIWLRQQALKRQLGDLKGELEAARQRGAKGSSSQSDYAQTLDCSPLKGAKTRIQVLASFRGGSGTSTVVANLGILLAGAGYRVALLDLALENPGLHSLFGLSGQELGLSLQDILMTSKIDTPPIELGPRLGLATGQLKLIPSSTRLPRLAQVLRQGYSPQALTQALQQLMSDYPVDFLLIDTQAGLNEELVLSLLLANGLTLLLRPDPPDLEGAGVLVQVAEKLKIDQVQLLVNQVAPEDNAAAVAQRLQDTFATPVAGVLPRWSSSEPLLCLHQPQAPWSQALRQVMLTWLQNDTNSHKSCPHEAK